MKTRADIFENTSMSGLISKVDLGSRVSSLLQIRRSKVLISERSGYKAYLSVDFDNTVHGTDTVAHL